MDWKNRKVVVTGAGGFIGSHLVEALTKLNASVRAFDFIPPARRFDLPELIRCLVENGETVSVFHHEGYWLDIGRPEDYRQALEEFPAMRDRFLVD